MAGGSSAPVVNICFHGIGEPARELEEGEAPYWITAEFYATLLDEFVGDSRVRLSFDDGNASDAQIGLPALVQRGLTATFYVLAGRIDQPGSLTEADIRALVDAGMTIGTHGMDHRSWRGLSPADLHRELSEARAQISEVTGRPVDWAALPLGRYDRRTLSHLRRLGYRSVGSSDRRWSTDHAWLQPRFSVRSNDTLTSVRQDMLTPHPRAQQLKLGAIGVVKRWR